MNEPTENLERELAALRPHKPSADLRRRIEQELHAVEHTNRPSSAAVWSLAITAAALAACLLLAMLPQRPNRKAVSDSGAKVVELPTVSDSLPTFWAFHRAVTMPTQSLDSLLDRHADHFSAPDDSLLHVHAFRPFDSQNQTDRGDL